MGSYFEPGRGWRFDFRLFGQRHRSPRGWSTKRDSDDAEAALRRKLQRQRAGIEPEPEPVLSPSITAWAGEYFAYVEQQAALGLIKRPEIIEANIRSVLRFWGQRPSTGYVHPTGPYHHLTLADPIRDPTWLRQFDAWMTSEGLAGSTRNHYQTTMSRLYWLALHPEYRQQAGPIPYNPFRGRPRARWRRRTATLTPAQLVAWLGAASYHVRLAVAIAALAPKLRLRNVLALQWADVDLDARTITVWDHKTDADGRALVAPIVGQLHAVLVDARTRHPKAKAVVVYRHRPVRSIDGGLKAAALAAGLTWGRSTPGGVTFHSLRHTASTWLPRLGVGPVLHQAAIGHDDFATTQWYTHLTPDDERAPLELWSAQVPLLEAVTAARTRPPRGMRPKARPAAQAASCTARGDSAGQGDSRGESSGQTGRKSTTQGPFRGLRRGPVLRRPAPVTTEESES